MKHVCGLFLGSVSLCYLLLLWFTAFSLTGYFTDFLIGIMLLLGFAGFIKLMYPVSSKWVLLLLLFFVGGVSQKRGGFGIFMWDALKTKSFLYEEVDGRMFHAYFTPVGAYSGGEGVFWITESPIHFPFIEQDKYIDAAVLWDFRLEEWEGTPVDQQQIVREYIKEHILLSKESI